MESKYFKTGYIIRDQNAPYFLTFTVCGWIDLFTRKEYKDILIDSFRFCQQQKGLTLYAYVIMSNHIHLIASAKEGFALSDIIRDYKKYTHHQMIAIAESDIESRRLWMLHQFKYYGSRNSKNENYQIWTNSNHPEACFSETFTFSKIKYIHENPVRAGIIAEAADYIYSSAAVYAGKKGMIDVEVV